MIHATFQESVSAGDRRSLPLRRACPACNTRVRDMLKSVAMHAFASVVLAVIGWSTSVHAQQAPAPSALPKPGASEQEVVELSRFIVTEDSTETYEANNTSGVTGTNREIRKLPITMNVATTALLKEVNARNFLDVIELMPNVAPTTPDTNNGGAAQQDTYRLRGMTSKEERRRNGVLSLAIPETFSTERIEFLRGAQSLLYGQGISTGAVNVVTKRATFGKRLNELSVQFDDLGSHRFTLDGNYSRGNVAARVAAVNAKKLFWQDQLLDNTRGVYAELAYRLSRSLVARVNHEHTVGHATYRGGTLTISDNSLRDPRNNLQLDRVLYEKRDVSDISLGGKVASWTNYRSVSSMTNGRDSRSNVTNLSLEGTFGRNLSALVSYSYEHGNFFNNFNNSGLLLSPNDSRAANRQWSYTVDPGASLIRWYLETLRGNMIYRHTMGNFLKGDLVFGFESRFKWQTINRKRLYAVDASGVPVAGGGLFGRIQLAPNVVPVSNALSGRFTEVPGYKWMDTHAYNVVTPTPLNPRGLGGVGTPIDRPERQKAVNLSWLGTWFDGRLETMAGLRRDHILLRDKVLNNTDNDSAKTSGLVGGVFNVTRNIGFYFNAARSFSAVPATRLQVYDNSSSEWPVASGKSLEGGLKFDILKDRISGALSFYDNKNHGELVGASTGQLDLFNPFGINGRYGGVGSFTGMYVEARGTELTVTMRPAKGWRMILTAGTNDAKTVEPSRAAILYNDQFNTIGATVAVKSASGELTPLLVPSVRTDPNSPRIPLTTAMMRDSGSPYFAQLDPASGRIVNANSLFLSTNGVATGVNGLPISQHQLGFQAPGNGVATVIQPGDSLSPVAGKSAMFNTTYTFSAGPLSGVSVGGLLSWRGDYRLGYAVINGTRQMYYAPEQFRADLRLGYNWTLASNRSISFQLSASNLTDKQTLMPSLNVSNGTATSVSIVEAPRAYVLTANLRF